MSTISTIFCFQVEINQIVKGNISALSCKNPTSCRRKRIDFRQDEWIDVDFENGGEKKGRRNERRTQFFDEAQHDAADVQVALDAQASLDAEVGDDHSEFPAAVAHHLSVGDHVVVGDRLAIDPDGKAPTGLALLFFRLLADFTDTCEPTRFVRDQTWTEDSSGSLTWLSVCLCVRVCVCACVCAWLSRAFPSPLLRLHLLLDFRLSLSFLGPSFGGFAVFVLFSTAGAQLGTRLPSQQTVVVASGRRQQRHGSQPGPTRKPGDAHTRAHAQDRPQTPATHFPFRFVVVLAERNERNDGDTQLARGHSHGPGRKLATGWPRRIHPALSVPKYRYQSTLSIRQRSSIRNDQQAKRYR